MSRLSLTRKLMTFQYLASTSISCTGSPFGHIYGGPSALILLNRVSSTWLTQFKQTNIGDSPGALLGNSSSGSGWVLYHNSLHNSRLHLIIWAHNNSVETYITSLVEYNKLIIQCKTKCSVNQMTLLPTLLCYESIIYLVIGGRLAHGHHHRSLDVTCHSPTLPPTTGWDGHHCPIPAKQLNGSTMSTLRTRRT